MNLLKKLWNFLFGSKEEPMVLTTPAEENKETVKHCNEIGRASCRERV